MEASEYQQLKDQIKKLADSLGPYCMTPCEARCCRVGALLIEETDATLFSNKTLREDGLSIVPLQGVGCEHLSSQATCGMYTLRPRLCQEFPFFLKNKTLLIANWCPAIKEGLLLPEIMKLEEQFPEVKIIYI